MLAEPDRHDVAARFQQAELSAPDADLPHRAALLEDFLEFRLLSIRLDRTPADFEVSCDLLLGALERAELLYFFDVDTLEAGSSGAGLLSALHAASFARMRSAFFPVNFSQRATITSQ